MSYYLIQASYTQLHGLWFTFGDTDIVAIAEMPNNISATAISMAIGASGVMRRCGKVCSDVAGLLASGRP